MRDLLTKYGIPATNIADAAAFLNSASNGVVESFTKEFGLNLNTSESLTASRFAADAIFRGADTVGKVVGYVAKRMLGGPAPKSTGMVTMVLAGIPSVDNSNITVTPVMTINDAATAPIHGKRGRPRLGNSGFAKAVALLDTFGEEEERSVLLDCIIASGINEKSAMVYLWKYKKGLRE
jgi:hypothetical protein